MKAAVLTRFDSPLEVTEVADPSPGPGEVLVRVRAAGLCGTDLKVVAGTLPGLALPLVPGHEIAGEVVGDGTAVACYHYEPCGRCRYCLAGDEALCPDAARVGRSRDGGLAELVVMREENVFPFAGLDPALAAVAMDAVATPWRALHRRAQLRPGEHLAVAGAGGLGSNAIQIAVDLGASVAVVDPDPGARTRALALGAEAAVAPEDAGELGGWADAGLEASGRRGGFDALVAALRPGGRIVCCGYAPGAPYELDSMRLVLAELSVLGSRAASREDARAALAAVAEGRVVPQIDRTLPLDRVNDGLDLLRDGGLAGRVVIVP